MANGETQIISLSIVCMIVLFNPQFQGLAWRRFRLGCFLRMGASGFAPLIHGFVIYGGPEMANLSVQYYLGEGALLLLGATFYSVSTCIEWLGLNTSNVLEALARILKEV